MWSVGWPWTTEPVHLVWNFLAAGVFVLAFARLVSPSARPLRQGWKSKILWTLGLLFTVSFGAYYLPIGPVMVIVELHRGRRQLALDPQSPSVL